MRLEELDKRDGTPFMAGGFFGVCRAACGPGPGPPGRGRHPLGPHAAMGRPRAHALALLDGGFTGPDCAGPYDDPHHTMIRTTIGQYSVHQSVTRGSVRQKVQPGSVTFIQRSSWDIWRRASMPPW